MNKVRVVIADDHALFREGVSLLLASTGKVEVVGEAADGREAVEKARALRPDIVIMDIGMPVMTGLQASREIKQALPQAKILIVTMHATDDYFFEALESGASGYVLKEGASTDLHMAIEALSRGEMFLYPSLQRKLVEDYLNRVGEGEEGSSYQRLTPREREVLQLIAEGYTNQEIADHLKLAISTVQTHRGHIMEKLDLHSRAQLMRYAIRTGLLRRRS